MKKARMRIFDGAAAALSSFLLLCQMSYELFTGVFIAGKAGIFVTYIGSVVFGSLFVAGLIRRDMKKISIKELILSINSSPIRSLWTIVAAYLPGFFASAITSYYIGDKSTRVYLHLLVIVFVLSLIVGGILVLVNISILAARALR